MTKAAQAFGKRDARDFFVNAETQDYIQALAQMTGMSVNSIKEVKRGNGGGTWGHPKLAVKFACWLDVRFAVWCDMVIDDILKGAAEVTIVKPEESSVVALMAAPKRHPNAA